MTNAEIKKTFWNTHRLMKEMFERDGDCVRTFKHPDPGFEARCAREDLFDFVQDEIKPLGEAKIVEIFGDKWAGFVMRWVGATKTTTEKGWTKITLAPAL